MAAEATPVGIAKYAREIRKSAKDQLSKSARGFTYTAHEQGGVKLTEDDSLKLDLQTHTRVTHLLGITALTRDLRYSLFEEASQGQITDSSKFAPEERVVTNQAVFAQELLGNNPKILDELAEITAKAQIFTEALQNEDPNTSQDLAVRVNAWKQTVSDVAQVLCATPSEKVFYQGLVENKLVALSNPDVRRVKGKDGSVARQSYKERLAQLIGEERARRLIGSKLDSKRGGELADKMMDEYLETAFTLNAVRVLDRIQRPLGFNGKFRKLTSCLEGREADPNYLQIIEANNLTREFDNLREQIVQISNSSLKKDEKEAKIEELNKQFKEKCQPLLEDTAINNDETIDLIETRQSMTDIQQKGREIQGSDMNEFQKKSELAELDKEMQDLFIAVANKIQRIFPNQTRTNLKDVLADENAICAGKVNIMLAVTKFLGVNARACSVKEGLDSNDTPHVYFEGDLPSGNKLAIDANFGNARAELEGKTDEELVVLIRKNNPGISDRQVESSLKYTKLAVINARRVPAQSRILMYMTENTGLTVANSDDLENTRNNTFLFVRIDPYSSRKEVWRASIEYPHLITAPDKDGYLFINSSFTYNTGHFIGISKGESADIGIYLLRKHIEMNPHDVITYFDLANLLPGDEGAAFLEQVRENNPDLYWDGIAAEHALSYAYKGNLARAREIFEETKKRNISLYYNHLFKLAGVYRNQGELATDEAAGTELKSYAQTLMENARRENPRLFYSQDRNVWEITRFYYHDDDQRQIEIYEEYQRVHEENFWHIENSNAPFQQLMDLYTTQAKTDPTFRDKALELVTEIKNREPRFYAKNVHAYASNIYLNGDIKEPEKALVMLEGVRRDSPQVFFQYDQNIKALAELYKSLNQEDKAISLYEQSREFDSPTFWNNEYQTLYQILVRLYANAGQIDKAIQVSEEAKIKSAKFWEGSYYDGSGQLAALYMDSGKPDQALALLTEATQRDPKFFNPNGSSGYIQMAAAYESVGQIDEAIKVMLRGRNKDKNFWEKSYWNPNVFTLINLYEKNGQQDEVISFLEQVKEKNPRFWNTDYYRICQFYEERGEVERANQIRKELMETYEGLKVTNQEEYYLSSERLARLYVHAEHIQQAINTLEEGREHNPFFPPSSFLLLADLYIRSGNKDGARQTYERVINYLKGYNVRPDVMESYIKRAQSAGINIST